MLTYFILFPFISISTILNHQSIQISYRIQALKRGRKDQRRWFDYTRETPHKRSVIRESRTIGFSELPRGSYGGVCKGSSHISVIVMMRGCASDIANTSRLIDSNDALHC